MSETTKRKVTKTQLEIEQMASDYAEKYMVIYRPVSKDERLAAYLSYLACYTALLPDLTAMHKEIAELKRELGSMYALALSMPDHLISERKKQRVGKLIKELEHDKGTN